MSATVTGPGVYADLPAAEYHADPIAEGSLSFSLAKVLLQEAGPAKYRQIADHPEHKAAYDLGNAAHAYALGKDADRLVTIDATDYKTKAAQEAKKAAYAAGLTPLLPKQRRQAEDMAAKLDAHPEARPSLAGQTEVSMFHQMGSGLWLRGRMDVMAEGWTTDYKTCQDASSSGFIRQAWKLRYFMQAAWYRWLRWVLTGDMLPYRIVAQEVDPPYLVSVWNVDADYLRQGEDDMWEAVDIYWQCVQAGKWPGYPDQIQPLTPPDWALPDLEV